MPNWCYNTLWIEGSHADLEAIEKLGMDFNKILPMPQPFLDDLGENGTNIGGQSPREGTPEAKIKAEWVKTYGHDGWYSWCNENWDTKWSASNVEFSHDGDLTVKFDTAWGHPAKVIAKLAAMFPETTIQHTWRNEGDEPCDTYEGGILA